MVFYTFHAYTALGCEGVAHGPSKQETPTINMYADAELKFTESRGNIKERIGTVSDFY